MREFFWKHDAGVKFALLVLILLASANLLLVNQNLRVAVGGSEGGLPIPQVTSIDTCGVKCQKFVEEKITEAVATLSARPAATVRQQGGVRTSTIAVGSNFSTKNTDWTDIRGGEVTINPADYGSDLAVSWSGSLKVAHGNGRAFARLFDATNGIAVAASEISTTSADFTQAAADGLSLWSGSNVYRVQVKSLNGFEITFDGGNIKIMAR